MREQRKKLVLVVASLMLIIPSPGLCADEVAPGDVIDKGNWEKAEGLLPPSVLEWVKKGEYVIKVGQLNYDQKEFFAPWVGESFQANVGKYDVDEKGQLVEAATRKPPSSIVGIPFPDNRPDDPKVCLKALYNKSYHGLCYGNFVYPFDITWVGRSGFEREVAMVFANAVMDGYPGAQELSNPERTLRLSLYAVLSPYDIKGTAILLWRYKGDKQDVNFTYLPAIRRVRRMTPANRSDALVGCDAAIDDAWGFDAKENSFEWQFLRTQEALVPFASTEPEVIVQNENGEWHTTPEVTPITYGYQASDWKGAPWAGVNWTWVKRTVWVIKGKPKDPYYNYGFDELWYDPDIYFPKYLIIYDRSGAYWKTFTAGHGGFQSADQKMRYIQVTFQHMVDDRFDHCSIIEHMSKRNMWVHFAHVNLNDFTLAGFQKFCK
ncbi:MAG: DUF1329 domain-containing protein [bacterium]